MATNHLAPKVLFVASELTPIAKVGGLGDVIGSLPQALRKCGVDARVIIPRYEMISRGKLRFIGSLDPRTRVYETQVRGVPVYCLDNPRHLSRGPIYFSKTAFVDSQREFDRFMFFSKAVSIFLDKEFFLPDIVHCNDWHTGALARSLRGSRVKTVFTIHNLANQGIWNRRNLMAEGIRAADFVTTVSPTYGREILASAQGEGLEGLLRRRNRERKLKGILNGIDTSFWPITKRNKTLFEKSIGLRFDAETPLFGLVARLTKQKGIHLILPFISGLIEKKRARFVFLGQGERKLENRLQALAKRFPESVFTEIGFDEKLAHRVYANSDFFLMPSIFEPCGLGQMIAMHYGTIPIVRSTGGLRDSVKDGKTGFVFKPISTAALSKTMNRAIQSYRNKVVFKKMRKNCRQADFSWDASARQYEKLYRSLL